MRSGRLRNYLVGLLLPLVDGFLDCWLHKKHSLSPPTVFSIPHALVFNIIQTSLKRGQPFPNHGHGEAVLLQDGEEAFVSAVPISADAVDDGQARANDDGENEADRPDDAVVEVN